MVTGYRGAGCKPRNAHGKAAIWVRAKARSVANEGKGASSCRRASQATQCRAVLAVALQRDDVAHPVAGVAARSFDCFPARNCLWAPQEPQ